jgi:hypothetical protein
MTQTPLASALTAKRDVADGKQSRHLAATMDQSGCMNGKEIAAGCLILRANCLPRGSLKKKTDFSREKI